MPPGTGHAVTPRATPTVLHSGEYFLFESDSEEEEEEAALVPEEPQPDRQNAFKVTVAWGGVAGEGVSWCPRGADGPSPVPLPQFAFQALVTKTPLQQQEQPESPSAEAAAGGSGSPENGAGGGPGGDAALPQCPGIPSVGFLGGVWTLRWLQWGWAQAVQLSFGAHDGF